MSAENRSEWAVLASATAAPLLLWGCGASWLWMLLGGGVAAAIYALVSRLQPEQDLAQLTRSLFGKRMGTVLLWLQLAALALGAGYLLRQTDPVVPNVVRGYPWIPAVLCVLALAGAWRGRKAALASGSVLFWLVLLTLGAVTLFSVPQIRINRMVPEGGLTQILSATALFLLPIMCLYCRKPEGRKLSLRLHLLVVLAGVLVVFVTTACLSPRLAADEALPFFTLAASCRLLGHAARFDAVLCMTVIAAMYCLLILMLNFCRQLDCKKEAIPMLVFTALALVSSWTAPDAPGWGTGVYLVLMWGILPVCCVFLSFRKKSRKNEKSC